MSEKWAAPGGWTVESATLSLVPPRDGTIADQLGLAGPGEYLIVRRNGRTIRWCRNWAEVHAAGCPAELGPATAAYPPPPVPDPGLAARRLRKRAGGTREYWAAREAAGQR